MIRGYCSFPNLTALMLNGDKNKTTKPEQTQSSSSRSKTNQDEEKIKVEFKLLFQLILRALKKKSVALVAHFIVLVVESASNPNELLSTRRREPIGACDHLSPGVEAFSLPNYCYRENYAVERLLKLHQVSKVSCN